MNKEELLKNFLNEKVTLEYKDHSEKSMIIEFLKKEKFKPAEIELYLFYGYFEILYASDKVFTDYDMSVKQSNLISFEDFLQIAQNLTPPTKKIFVLKINLINQMKNCIFLKLKNELRHLGVILFYRNMRVLQTKVI